MKELLGLAGEFAVASELCKRGVYAQLTLGKRKRADLWIDTGDNLRRVEVKTKRQKTWPKVAKSLLVLAFTARAELKPVTLCGVSPAMRARNSSHSSGADAINLASQSKQVGLAT